MEKYLPIIYVRGYAGSQGAVESTVDKPYYGFNLGSTQVRTGPDGDPDFFIFESPLVRLIRDHGYTDLFARIDRDGAVELLNGEDLMGVFDSETNMAGMQPDVACWHRWKKCNDDSIQDMMLWSWSII